MKIQPKIYRAWINQPSSLQPLRERHGQRCIAVEEPATQPQMVTLYFTEGAVHSLRCERNCIVREYL